VSSHLLIFVLFGFDGFPVFRPPFSAAISILSMYYDFSCYFFLILLTIDILLTPSTFRISDLLLSSSVNPAVNLMKCILAASFRFFSTFFYAQTSEP